MRLIKEKGKAWPATNVAAMLCQGFAAALCARTPWVYTPNDATGLKTVSGGVIVMTTDKPTATDYVLQVASASYQVVAMERTSDPRYLMVEVQYGASPWLNAGTYPATLRLKDWSAHYDGTYAVFDYRSDSTQITIKGMFTRLQ